MVPALEQLARAVATPSRPAAASTGSADANGGDGSLLPRFHAMWTLEGLNALDAPLVRELMKDENPRMRVQAIRASESLYKAGDRSFADDYRAMTKDADPNVVIQAMLTTNLLKLSDASEVISAAKASSRAKGVALIADRLLTPAGPGVGARPGTFTPEEEKRLESGKRRVQLRVFDVSRRGRHRQTARRRRAGHDDGAAARRIAARAGAS